MVLAINSNQHKEYNMITKYKVIMILQQHGIETLSDDTTGSSFYDDFGIHDTYNLNDVMVWLGY